MGIHIVNQMWSIVQVTLPSLESLLMYELDNVIAMWHNEFPLEFCCKLKQLVIFRCNKLLNVFPSNILKGVQSLDDVQISDCDSIEEIFDLQGVNCKEIHDNATIPLSEYGIRILKDLSPFKTYGHYVSLIVLAWNAFFL